MIVWAPDLKMETVCFSLGWRVEEKQKGKDAWITGSVPLATEVETCSQNLSFLSSLVSGLVTKGKSESRFTVRIDYLPSPLCQIPDRKCLKKYS